MSSVFQRRGDWRSFLKTSPVTALIILANTLFLIYTMITGGFGALHLVELGGITSTIVEDQEWWRIITAAFLHGGVLHYLSNTIIGLLALSSGLERLIGSKKFSFIYFGSLILSGIAVSFMSSAFVTIGASGAIFGALGSLLYITFYRRDMLSPQDIQSVRGLIVVNILFTVFAGGISISGHVGGIVAGLLLSFIVIRRDSNKEIY